MRSLLSLPITAIAVGFTVAPGNYAEGGNATQGEHAFAKCVGRHAGSVPGFSYSQAMKNSNIAWDEKSLDAFLMAPQKALPGTTMLFPGIPRKEERNDVIAYLETLK